MRRCLDLPPSFRSFRCIRERERLKASIKLLDIKRFHGDYVAQAHLVHEHGFAGRYPSVRRYVARLGSSTPLPFRRMEVVPGAEAQIDFGKGAPVIDNEGRRRRTHVLRVVLSHSRKGYSEVVYRQTTENLLRCLENAFMHFGGVPGTLVPDNLKAAVIRAD